MADNVLSAFFNCLFSNLDVKLIIRKKKNMGNIIIVDKIIHRII